MLQKIIIKIRQEENYLWTNEWTVKIMSNTYTEQTLKIVRTKRIF